MLDVDYPDGRLLAGRYRLLAELGRGGMGVVWYARDELLGREVAVKEVRAPAGFDSRELRLLYTRLEREGRAAALVDHPNVITVHDVAMEDGRPWVVMELVRGRTLADVLHSGGPLPPAQAAVVGGAVLSALRVAHNAGVLHRDVKPGNVLIGDDGRVVLTDFGIAAIEGGQALTMPGQVVGSPEYLAPERARGERPGPASDLWSLGVLMYVAVEGVSPFRRDTALNTLRAVVDDDPPPPVLAGPLTPVLAGLLRKWPSERVGSEVVQRMLAEAAAGRPPRLAAPSAGRASAPAPQTVPAGPPVRPPVRPPARPPVRPPARPPAPAQPPAPPPESGRRPGAGPRRHPRRAVAAMAAGLLALFLAAAGTAWALLGGDGGSRRPDRGAVQPVTPHARGERSASRGVALPLPGHAVVTRSR